LSKLAEGQALLHHDELIKESIRDAEREIWNLFPGVHRHEVVVDVLVCWLSCS
jgi:hypothetical protein